MTNQLPRASNRDMDATSEEELPRRTEDLIQTIREYADKLVHDGTTRGDLKILSRTLRELRYAFKVFSPYRKNRKVTIFGSARTLPDAPTYKLAMELGREMAARDWMVITGAASGIMEAGHRGAGRDHAMGLNIMLPFEQSANEVIAGDAKLVHMKYFFTRKLMFVKECDAVVCLPGGFGTLDEALEVLTLLQTGKHDMMPVVFLDEPGGSYWRAIDEFFRQHLLAKALISPEDVNLYHLSESVADTVAEVTGFYRNYHSMRFVKNQLVFRLQRPLSAEELAVVNEQFADILSEGQFRQAGPLPAERDDPQLNHLSRLTFHFNRRSLGRLRKLIDHLNKGNDQISMTNDQGMTKSQTRE